MPNRDTPPALIEAWLQFHRDNLCRELDVVFAFAGQGMELWCRSEDNRPYRKLQKLLNPLSPSYLVELYTTRPPRTDDNRRHLPPAIAENQELRAWLRPGPGIVATPQSVKVTVLDQTCVNNRLASKPDSNMDSCLREVEIKPGFSDQSMLYGNNQAWILRARLASWTNAALEDSRIMRQYAGEIPDLLRIATEPLLAASLRRRALTIGLKHAQELVKSVRELHRDLARALPKAHKSADANKDGKDAANDNDDNGDNDDAGNVAAPPSVITSATTEQVITQAEVLAAAARERSQSVYRFIYPRQHKVDVADLLRPDLLSELENMATDAAAFVQVLRGATKTLLRYPG